MIPNPFRRKKNMALTSLKGHFNPCRYCWRPVCRKCLVFYLVDFSLVLRNSPELSKRFEELYNKVRGHEPSTRKERRTFNKGARKMAKQRAKVRRNREATEKATHINKKDIN